MRKKQSKEMKKVTCRSCQRKVKTYRRGNPFKGPTETLMYNHNDVDGKRCLLSGFPGEGDEER